MELNDPISWLPGRSKEEFIELQKAEIQQKK
jgi:hypothetical protein